MPTQSMFVLTLVWGIDMVQQALIKRYLKYIDIILANSRFTQQYLLASGLPVTDVQYYFIPTSCPPLPFPSTPPTVCFIGRLVPEKGVDVLLQAMRQVVDRLSDARLLIVGDGPEKGRLQRLSQKLALGEAVTFLGHVAHDRLDECFGVKCM